MPRPWEMTKAEWLAYGDDIREETRAANREAAPLFREQMSDEPEEAPASTESRDWKEPWEMTKAEWLTHGDRVRERVRAGNRAAAGLFVELFDDASVPVGCEEDDSSLDGVED